MPSALIIDATSVRLHRFRSRWARRFEPMTSSNVWQSLSMANEGTTEGQACQCQMLDWQWRPVAVSSVSTVNA